MKRFTLAIRILFFLFYLLISNPTKNFGQEAFYSINGDIKGAEGKTIYLQFTKKKISDSVRILNNTFRFEGQISGMEIVMMKLGDEILPIALQAGQLRLDGIFGALSKAKVSGQQSAIDFSAAKQIADSFMEKLVEIRKSMQIAIKNKDTTEMIRLGKENDAIYPLQVQAFKDWVKAHPNSLISPLIIQNDLKSLPISALDQLVNSLSDDVKSSTGGQSMLEFIRVKKLINVGAEAPDFKQKDKNGNTFTLSSLKGNYVVLDFWASWCVPCREVNPAMVKLFNSFKEKNFKIIGVSLDEDRKNWINAMKADQLPWLNVSDLKGWNSEVVKQFNVTALPTTFLIDPNGKIVAININVKELSERLSSIFKLE